MKHESINDTQSGGEIAAEKCVSQEGGANKGLSVPKLAGLIALVVMLVYALCIVQGVTHESTALLMSVALWLALSVTFALKKQSLIIAVFGSMFLSALASIVFLDLLRPEEAKVEIARAHDHGIAAYSACKEFVAARLTSPSSASFPVFPESMVRVGAHKEQVYAAITYVDSQNAFGAMIRSRWSCRVQRGSEAGQWSELSINTVR